MLSVFSLLCLGLNRAGGRKRVDGDEALESLKEGQLRHPEKRSKS